MINTCDTISHKQHRILKKNKEEKNMENKNQELLFILTI